MCFSEGASFIGCAVLAGTGITTLALSRGVRDLPLAVIPVIFAVQQFSEGLVWRSVDASGTATATGAVTVFLCFALIWWPIFVPLVAWFVEPPGLRRGIFAACGAVGVAVAVHLALVMLSGDVGASVDRNRMVYDLPAERASMAIAPYIAVTCLPLLLSSISSLRTFGMLVVASAAASALVYSQAFISVWCFMAAVLSVVVLVRLINLRVLATPMARS